MRNYSSFAQMDRHLPTGLCSFAHLVESSSQCKTVSSSSESALPATGTHSQCQQEFPGSGFVTTCLSSQAHNAEGGLRWLPAPWGMEGDLCCVRGTVTNCSSKLYFLCPIQRHKWNKNLLQHQATLWKVDEISGYSFEDEGAEEITQIKN